MELKRVRVQQGYTQKQVAHLACISERAYQSYELGIRKPSVDVAQRIAKALNSTVEELFKIV